LLVPAKGICKRNQSTAGEDRKAIGIRVCPKACLRSYACDLAKWNYATFDLQDLATMPSNALLACIEREGRLAKTDDRTQQEKTSAEKGADFARPRCDVEERQRCGKEYNGEADCTVYNNQFLRVKACNPHDPEISHEIAQLAQSNRLQRGTAKIQSS